MGMSDKVDCQSGEHCVRELFEEWDLNEDGICQACEGVKLYIKRMSSDQPKTKHYPVVWDERHYIRFWFDTEEERQAFLEQPDLDKALEIANNLLLRQSVRPISRIRVEEGEE